MIAKIYKFIKSFIQHIYRGSPKSSQKLIDKRYKICLDCDKINKDKSICLVCGCNINNQPILLNKLAWADQKCPINKW